MGVGNTSGLLLGTGVASFVEFVEALTIVLAMGMTRGWRSTLTGMVAALVALAAFTVAMGYALASWLPEALLQLVIGALLLIFGLQWLRKAILRSSGRKATHDEAEEFTKQTEESRSAGRDQRFGLDWFAFVVSFKGVFLEGVEVVFIVITFGLNADNVPLAAAGAAGAGVIVLVLGALVHKPLTAVPENTLKYGVGLLLASFGTYWAVEGIGLVGGAESLAWPGQDWAILALLAGWFLLSRIFVTVLRVKPKEPAPVTAGTREEIA